jgi:hypothetical protein
MNEERKCAPKLKEINSTANGNKKQKQAKN